MHGHATYLLGEASDKSIWYYFPVLFTIKLPLPPMLLLLALAALRPRSLLNWATAVGDLARCCSASNCRVQIGIRLNSRWWF